MIQEPHIIVVDDEPDLREMLAEYLARHGFSVAAAGDGRAFRAVLAEREPALVILDVTMPGEDGFSLARAVRARSPSPGIIMLTANGELADRVSGLEAGADDYIVKPFAPRELLARVRSLLRRLEERRTAAPAPRLPAAVRFGRYRLDRAARRLEDEAGSAVVLSAMEYDLLCVFADNPGRVMRREELLARAHNKEMQAFERSLDMRITRLRRKIETNPELPRIIRTIRGEGYLFSPEGE
jgi:two-component system phosphate regulon response regulator OmpR